MPIFVVPPGDTLSQIGTQFGVPYQAIAQANGIADPNIIYAGQRLVIPAGGSFTAWHPSSDGDGDHDGDMSDASSAPVSHPFSPASVTPVQAAPGSFQACVIQRESGGDSQVMNSSGHYGLYQFSAAAWAEGGGNPADFGHASVGEQNRVFNGLYAVAGTSPWAPYDGC